MNERTEIDKDLTVEFEEFIKKEPLENKSDVMKIQVEDDIKMETEQKGIKRTFDDSSNNVEFLRQPIKSQLPLLFADGCPISLQSMNLMELQRFILFLLKCEHFRPIKSLDDIEQPRWWPTEVAFKDNLFQKSYSEGVETVDMLVSKLRLLIQRCYAFHNASDILEFSKKLMIGWTSGKIQLSISDDETRSLHMNHKRLVTYNHESQEYDTEIENSVTELELQVQVKIMNFRLKSVLAKNEVLEQRINDVVRCIRRKRCVEHSPLEFCPMEMENRFFSSFPVYLRTEDLRRSALRRSPRLAEKCVTNTQKSKTC